MMRLGGSARRTPTIDNHCIEVPGVTRAADISTEMKPPRCEAEEVWISIRQHIESLTPKQQSTVMQAYGDFRATMTRFGGEGEIALSLLGAEEAMRAEGLS